ncbi:methyltransferase domain-containing protein [Streptomyces sp. NPDC051940]|uniref:class I SAM-dependent methyltransferase n=1 Tax=Streptomyces sp. NPDC051940 TaxID=3155675 RepID=UPI003431253B
MSVSADSLKAWEGFWADAPEGEGAVFWDAPPALAAQLHLPLFADHFQAGLPLVDVGCGNGTQTRYLAGRYRGVHGVDLSAAAVERARSADPAGRAGYEQADAADEAAMERLHGRLGDCDVYLRGVLHQAPEPDRPRIVRGIAALTGGRGRVFAVELAEAAKPVLMGLAQRPQGPPAKLLPVLTHGIVPGEVSDAALPRLFREAGLTVLADGELPLATTEFEADGSRLALPSKWLVAGHVTVAQVV